MTDSSLKEVLETPRTDAAWETGSKAEVYRVMCDLERELAEEKAEHRATLEHAAKEREEAERVLSDATKARDALRLLEGMDALEVSVLGTYLQGGDIPETVNAAHAQVVRRMLEAERALSETKVRVREIFSRRLNLHYDQRAYSWHEIQDALEEVDGAK